MVLAGTALIAAGSAIATKAAAKDAGFSGGAGSTSTAPAPEFAMTSSDPGRQGFERSNEIYGEVVVKGQDLSIALSNYDNKKNRT